MAAVLGTKNDDVLSLETNDIVYDRQPADTSILVRDSLEEKESSPGNHGTSLTTDSGLPRIKLNELLLSTSEENLNLLISHSHNAKKVSEKLWASHVEFVEHVKSLHAKLAKAIKEDLPISKIEYGALSCDLGNPKFKSPPTVSEAAGKYAVELADPECEKSYGMTSGTTRTKVMFAEKFREIYGFSISMEDICMTLGGLQGLKTCYSALQEISDDNKQGVPIYIVPSPIYPPYKSYNTGKNKKSNHIIPLDVTRLPGFRLTAEALEKTLTEALEQAKNHNSAVYFEFNNPHNPTGICYTNEEVDSFFKVLRKFPQVKIILDLAYSRHGYDIIYPKAFYDEQRIIFILSGTKNEGLAKQRVGCVVTKWRPFLEKVEDQIQDDNVHAPDITQFIYAYAYRYTKEEYYKELRKYYSDIIKYVYNGFRELGLAVKDELYDPARAERHAMYVLIDASPLFGKPKPNKDGGYHENSYLENDEDVIRAFIVKCNSAFAAGSFFDTPGLIRVTCAEPILKWRENFERIKQWFAEPIMKMDPINRESTVFDLKKFEGVTSSDPDYTTRIQQIKKDIRTAAAHTLLETPKTTPLVQSPAITPSSSTEGLLLHYSMNCLTSKELHKIRRTQTEPNIRSRLE